MLKNRFLSLLTLIIIVTFCLFASVFSAKGRVIVIGLDGADPEVLKELIDKNYLPNLKFLITNGAFGTHNARDIVANGSLLSPIIWTSVATGRTPINHGISDMILDESCFFSQSNYRKVPAAWNIFSKYGRRTAVINWWVTYPAEKINGFIVTALASESFKQYIFKRFSMSAPSTKLPINLQNTVYPKNLYYELSTYRENYDKQEKKDFKLNGISIEVEDPEVIFKTEEIADYFYRFDRDSLAFAKYFMNRHKDLDLIMTYFAGIDALSHMFWYYRNTIDDYYRLTDQYVGQILRLTNKNDTIIICSDHGFTLRRDYAEQIRNNNFMTGSHRPQGIVIIYGNHIKKNMALKQVSLLDILPTILYLKGLPLNTHLEGRILFDCIDDNFASRQKPIFISDYGIKKEIINSPQEYPFRKNITERLKGLGYLN